MSGPRGVPGPREGVETPRDGYCCGWYASYWNAFLFKVNVHTGLLTFHKLQTSVFTCGWQAVMRGQQDLSSGTTVRFFTVNTKLAEMAVLASKY